MKKLEKTEKKSLQQSSNAIEALFADAMTRVKAQAAQTIIEQKTTSEAQARQAQQMIVNIEAEYEQKLAKANLDAEVTIANEKARAKKAAEQIAQLETELTEKQKNHAKQIADIKAETEESIANIEAEYEQQLAKAKAEAEEKITRIKTEAEANGENHNEEIDKIRTENEEKIKDLTGQISEIETKAAEEQKAYAKQIAKAEGEEVIAKIKAEHDEQISKIKAESDETIAQLKTEVGENAAKVKSEAEAEKKSYDDEIAKIKAESEERATVLAEQLAGLETEAAEKQKVHTEEIANINAEKEKAIAKIEADHEEQLAKARAEIEEKVQELEQTAEEKVEEIEVEAKGQAKVDDTDADVSDSAIEEKSVVTAESKESAPGEVAKAIQEMVESSAVLPDKQSVTSSGLCARDVMQKELIWAKSEDSVQQTLTKMQQSDTGYILIGHNGVPEGIVSKSDLSGAVSPYLRPEFAKWRRPLDDATLQIKVKWIMNKSPHTISPQTPLADIIKSMCQFDFCALPVIDEQGKVQGLVAEVNIFKAILTLIDTPDLCDTENVHQEQPASGPPADSESTQPAAETM